MGDGVIGAAQAEEQVAEIVVRGDVIREDFELGLVPLDGFIGGAQPGVSDAEVVMEVVVIGIGFQGNLILLNGLGVAALLNQVKALSDLARGVFPGGEIGGGAGGVGWKQGWW